MQIDLRGADLAEASIHEAFLLEANLAGAYLAGAQLSGANFARAQLSGAKFPGAKLTGANLSGAYLSRANLFGVDLHGANLTEASIDQANLIEADLTEANLTIADLRRANLNWANLPLASPAWANLIEADLTEANLSGANLTGADLTEAKLRSADLHRVNLDMANLTGADLTGVNLVGAQLDKTNLTNANLTGCHIYGVSAWNLTLAGAQQKDLIITRDDEPVIAVDNLEVAQFIYLLLHNEKIRDVIDTITSKAVLILGRFTPERKAILDAVREELRHHNYVPILFDFEKPTSRDLTETISTLAHMVRFIIADLTDAKSLPQELQAIVPNLPGVPVQPLLQQDAKEYAMFEHFRRYPWVLPAFCYDGVEAVCAALKEKIIAPAEAKAKELLKAGSSLACSPLPPNHQRPGSLAPNVGDHGPSDSALAASSGWRLRRPATDRHAARCASRDLCSGARHSAPCALG